MKLSVWGKFYRLIIADLGTRFCAAAVMCDKQSKQ